MTAIASHWHTPRWRGQSRAGCPPDPGSLRSLARRFGVSHVTIASAKRAGRCWRDGAGDWHYIPARVGRPRRDR